MTIALNFFIILLWHSDGIILTILVPSDKHHFVVIIATNAVCSNVRSDVPIPVNQLDEIRRFDKVKGFL